MFGLHAFSPFGTKFRILRNIDLLASDHLEIGYGGQMLRVCCVTKERHWLTHLENSFPNLIIEFAASLATVAEMPRFASARVDILIVDLESIPGTLAEQSVSLGSALPGARHTIALVPKKLSPVLELFQGYDVHVLHKPVTAGEITLAISRAIKKLTPKNNVSVSTE
jgi:hypothetical protein